MLVKQGQLKIKTVNGKIVAKPDLKTAIGNFTPIRFIRYCRSRLIQIGGQAAQIELEYATNIKEDYPLLISLLTKLGLNVSKIFDVAIEII